MELTLTVQQTKIPKRDFYVYVLFDADGIPRYVGKERSYRWKQHEYYKSGNRVKDAFITRTLALLGEIPKVKIRERLTEKSAHQLEILLIGAIGRRPHGSLTNMTDGGDGISGFNHSNATKEKLSVSRTKDQRTISGKLAASRLTPKERSDRVKLGLSNKSPEQLRDRSLKGAANTSPEIRKRNAKLARAARTKDSLVKTGKMTGQRLAQEKPTSFWVEMGRKGVAVANANRSPEEKTLLAKKAHKAMIDSRDPEELHNQRLAALEKAHAGLKKLTHEDYHKRNLKAWETRRAKTRGDA
jgi:hypothetical protein